VKVGRESARRVFLGLIAVAYVMLPIAILAGPEWHDEPWWILLGVLSLPLAYRAADPVLTKTDGPSLNEALAKTGALLGAFAILVSLGLLLAA
jgi:1,4-dihydroxy-2-naphthoate octaprenyltransferase